MIKEIEQIKMRKDIKYIADKYAIPLSSIAEYFGVNKSVMFYFISRNKSLRASNYEKFTNKINEFKETFKEAEQYKPNDLDVEWIYKEQMRNDLVEEIIAEIRRDIDMDNLMALQEVLSKLLENTDNKHILTRYLSEFPELREEYKDRKDV